jgi:hypothetical protein
MVRPIRPFGHRTETRHLDPRVALQISVHSGSDLLWHLGGLGALARECQCQDPRHSAPLRGRGQRRHRGG